MDKEAHFRRSAALGLAKAANISQAAIDVAKKWHQWSGDYKWEDEAQSEEDEDDGEDVEVTIYGKKAASS